MSLHLRSATLLNNFFDEFIKEFSQNFDYQLRILYSKKSIFLGNCSPFLNHKHTISKIGEGNPKQKFDLIFVNPTFTYLTNNHKQILNNISVIVDKGIAFVLLPAFENFITNRKFIKALNKKNFYINSVFQLPNEFLFPETAIRPILVSISKINRELVLFAELESLDFSPLGQYEILSKNLMSILYSYGEELCEEGFEDLVDESELNEVDHDEDLWNGVISTFDEFLGFEYWKHNNELGKINSDYKEFRSVKLQTLCSDIIIIKSGNKFDYNIKKSIFLPLIGFNPAVKSPQNFKIKHHNYAQLIIKEEEIDKDYIISYLNSKIGRLIIETKKSIGNPLIPKLSLTKVKNLEIKLPPFEIQKNLSSSVIKINEVHAKVKKIKSEIELNPLTSKDIEKLDLILQAMSEFTVQDKIRQRIYIGENRKTEFKETLSLDINTKQKNKFLEHASLKTITAFLNSEGGTLLIGVSDNQKIVGVEEEIDKFHKDQDKFLRHIKSLIKRSIGEEFYTYLDTNLIKIDNKVLMVVDVSPSDSEVYLDGKEFFVRSGPSTDKVEGRKLVEYCKRRFFNT